MAANEIVNAKIQGDAAFVTQSFYQRDIPRIALLVHFEAQRRKAAEVGVHVISERLSRFTNDAQNRSLVQSRPTPDFATLGQESNTVNVEDGTNV